MAGKRIATTSINWVDFAEKVPENARQHFRALKYRNDSYIRRVASRPDALPKIDWNFYKTNISIPGLVDSFKQKYESLTVPYPSDQGLISKINAEEKEMQDDLVALEKKLEVESSEVKKEIQKLENEIPYSEMSIEEYFLAKPEVALYPFGKPTLFPHLKEQVNFTQKLIDEGKLKA